MAEETVNNEDQVTISESESRARAGGWVPKEEWQGQDDEWVDYKEFNFRGELMERIQSQTKALKRSEKTTEELKKAIKVLGEHNAKLAEIQYDRAMKVLKHEKASALSEGDTHRVVEIDENINQLSRAKENSKFSFEEEEEEAPPSTPDENTVKEFNAWRSKPENSWYGTDVVLTGAADALAHKFATTHENFSVRQLTDYVEQNIRQEFPHKFQKSASKVAEPNNTGPGRSSSKKFSSKDLSEEQKSIARRFVSAGAFSNIQEYVDQLAEMGELPAQRGN